MKWMAGAFISPAIHCLSTRVRCRIASLICGRCLISAKYIAQLTLDEFFRHARVHGARGGPGVSAVRTINMCAGWHTYIPPQRTE
jgi:hypothetical protein